MHYIVKPSKLKGTLFVPPSKSHTLRAILFALMAKGISIIRNYLQSPDAIAMIEAIKLFGADVKMSPHHLKIMGVNRCIKPAEDVIQCGNSGQVLRFAGALSALLPTYTILTGDNSIRHNRPVKPLLDALSQLGVFAASSRLDHYAPIIIKGPVASGKVRMNGEDSQPVSGILILTAFALGKSEIHVTNPGEIPWIDLTLDWFKRLGISYAHKEHRTYEIPGSASYEGFEYFVPGDFSTAAYPIAAALITGSEITLTDIDMTDIQGDKELISILQKMGAQIEIQEKGIKIKKSHLHGIDVDLNRCIDALPILSVIACFAEGKTIIYNAEIARKKECDRIHATATELKKMHAQIEEKKDGLVIEHSILKGTELNSHHDHRMALSLTVAALGAKGSSKICDIACIVKTYPQFRQDFISLGAGIE